MSTSHIEELIINTSIKCTKMIMPNMEIVPKISMATMVLWAYLINEIAHEYHVTFYDEPRKITNSVAESINRKWMSLMQFVGIPIYSLISPYSTLLGTSLSPWKSNVIHNTYFTWRVGHCMDSVFAENCGKEFDYKIANQIIKSVGFFPSKEDFLYFLNDIPLSMFERKEQLK